MKLTAIQMIAITSIALLALGISTFLIVFLAYQNIYKSDFSPARYSPLFILEYVIMDSEPKNISYLIPCCTIIWKTDFGSIIPAFKVITPAWAAVV